MTPRPYLSPVTPPAGASDWVEVARRPTVLARLVAGALAAEGLEVHLDRDGLGAVYGLSTGAHATRVLVRAADLERARALLRELEDDAG